MLTSSEPRNKSAALRAAAKRRLRAPHTTAVAASAVEVVSTLQLRPHFVEVACLARVAPIYAVAHGAGMWRGLALLVAQRLRRRLA